MQTDTGVAGEVSSDDNLGLPSNEKYQGGRRSGP